MSKHTNTGLANASCAAMSACMMLVSVILTIMNMSDCMYIFVYVYNVQCVYNINKASSCNVWSI